MGNPAVAGDLTPREQQEQFLDLFERNGRRLFAFIISCLHNRQDADEVFGETCLILWREFSKFRQDAEFMPWASGIAFNQIRKFRRTQQRYQAFGDSLVLDLARDVETMADELEARREALEFCIQQLSRRQRTLLDLFYAQRVAAGAVAEQWRCSVHTIYKTLRETRRRLHACINRRVLAE